MRLETDATGSPLDLAVYILNTSGIRVLDEALSDVDRSTPLTGPATKWDVSLTVPPLLPAGDFVLGVWVGNEYETHFEREVMRFSLLPRPDDLKQAVERNRVVQPTIRWRAKAVDAHG